MPKESSITLEVETSLSIKGSFDTWDATLTLTSAEVTTGIAEVRIQASCVDTGRAIKNATLKGDDFFDVEHNPVTTFRSTKTLQSRPDTFELDGILRSAELRGPRSLHFRSWARRLVPERAKDLFTSIRGTT